MGTLKVTQRKSLIGGTKSQRESMRSLGLKRIRGMVGKVSHLVEVEETAE
jgi:large subunit ribosomal protein L30